MTPRRALVVRLTPGDPRPVDGLCPGCLLPALVEIDLCAVGPGGVTRVAVVRGCAEGCPPAT